MSRQHYDQPYGGSAAENYERHFVPAIGAPLANDLVEIADLRPGERLLDVACGTGVATRLAAQRVGTTGTVAGLDLNPGMLAVARSTTPSDTTIEWYEASAEKIPLPDASFDVVLCQMGLQFVADKPAALREMHRVLAPNGRLVLNVPGPMPPLMAVMGQALARHIGDEAEGFVRHVFSLHDMEELQNLIEDGGFDEASTRADTKTRRLPAPEERQQARGTVEDASILTDSVPDPQPQHWPLRWPPSRTLSEAGVESRSCLPVAKIQR